MKKNLFILLLFTLSTAYDAKSQSFTISDWNATCVENCLSIETDRLFVNERSDGLFRVDFSDSRYPRLYVFLRVGDSLSLSTDTVLFKINFQTNLQAFAELSDWTNGYQGTKDIRKLYHAKNVDEFAALADSITMVKLQQWQKLKTELGSALPRAWWDAEYCNIILLPLSILNYFLEDSTYLEYGQSILEKMPELPQNLLSRMLLAFASGYVQNYIGAVKHISNWQQPEYYNMLGQYFNDEVLEYIFATETMSGCRNPVTGQAIEAIYDFTLSKVKAPHLRKDLEEAKAAAIENRLNFIRKGVNIFHSSIDTNGQTFKERVSLEGATFIMVSSSGCAPCVKASRWLMEHYESIRETAKICMVIIGGIDRFKREQEKNPYPWPVFYDESGDIKDRLPRPSVPQYFLLKDGQLVNNDAPEPQVHFRDLVDGSRE